ncbi:MAG: AraC family transcriptional regulator [Lachnospiraceae bacterium]|nr:AraC family transcriptional regulator [Lachnospiraceae bacterium]
MNNIQYENYREIKEHTPIEFPYNTYLCSIPLDFNSVKIHWHNEIELIVIKKGCGKVTVDLNSYDVNCGDIVFIFSGQLHSIEQKDDNIMEYENIIFKPSLLKTTSPDLCNDNYLKPLFLGRIKIQPVINDTKIHNLIEEIDELRQSEPFGYQLIVKANLLTILFNLLKNYSIHNDETYNNKSLEKMKTILTYVSVHFKDNISIDDIAKECFYSKSHFMKFFKQNMGISFIKYLNEYRLDIASELLLKSNDNILDIAIKTGFENLSYFNRIFKEKYHISPGVYRKKGGFH